MSSELSPDHDLILQQLVNDGSFPNRQRALDRAVELLREEAETLDDLRAGIASMERGEGIPLEQAVQDLRRRLGIPGPQ